MVYPVNPSTQAFRRVAEDKKTPPPPVDDTVARTALMASVPDLYMEDDLFIALREGTEAIRIRMQNNEERTIREVADLNRRTQQLNDLASLRTDPEAFVEDRYGALLAMEEIAQNPSSSPDTALEQNYTEALDDIAATDHNRQALLESLDSDENPFELSRRTETNRLIWEREIDRVWQERVDRPWGWAVFEILGLAQIPFRDSMMRTGLFEDEGQVQGFLDNVFSGSAFREESATFHQIMDEMSPQEFSLFARELAGRIESRATTLGYTDLTLTSDIMLGMLDAPTATETNIYNALDNVPLPVDVLRRGVQASANAVQSGGRAANALEGVRTGIRQTENTVRPLVNQGSRSQAANVVADALITADVSGIEEALTTLGSTRRADLYSSVSPTAINPWGNTSSVSVANRANAIAEQGLSQFNEILQESGGDLLPSARLSESSQNAADAAAEARLLERAGRTPRTGMIDGSPVVDIAVRSEVDETGTTVSNVHGIFGQTDGAGFSDRRYAERYAREHGFNPENVFQDESGGWFVRASMPVTETGFYTDPLQMRVNNVLARFLSGGKSNTDDTLSDTVSGAREQRVTRAVQRAYVQGLRGISKADREAAAQIWQVGNRNAEWYTRANFDSMFYSFPNNAGRESESAWRAYRNTISFNDMTYGLRNQSIYRELQTQGFESVTVTNPRLNLEGVNGRQIEQVPSDLGALDLSTGAYRPAGSVELGEDMIAVRLQTPEELSSGGYVNVVVGRRSDFRFDPLSRDQLPYRPGGNRMPQGNFFVRQAQRVSTPDGRQTLASPRTYIGAKTISEAREWASVMEEVRLALRDGDVDSLRGRLNEILEGRRGYPSVDEILDDYQNGRFNTEDAFRVTEDRGLPQEYADINPNSAFFDPDEPPEISWARNHNGMYTGRRGDDVLRDWQGEAVPTLNMYEVMDRSLRNISRLSSFSDYRMEAVNRWAETYGRYIRGSENMSPMEMFRHGRLLEDLPFEVDGVSRNVIRNSAEAQRDQINRILRHKTAAGRAADEAQRQFIRFMDEAPQRVLGGQRGRGIGRASGRAAADIVEWWNTSNPVQASRAFAFDLKLGLFNVAQLPLQLQTSVAAWSLDPVRGFRGSINAPLAMLYKANGSDELLETWISRGAHKQLGMSGDEYRSYMRAIRRSGFFDMGGNHALVNDIGATGALEGYNDGLRRLRENARFIFNNAEEFNRLTASNIAWHEARRLHPNLDMNSAEFMRRWLDRTDAFSIRMDRTANAAWQEGLPSLATQFWSYPARVMDLLLGDTFTRQQRAQLLIGQSVLYGSYGVPGVSALMYLTEKLGGAPDEIELNELGMYEPPTGLWTAEGWFRRGALDHLTNFITGLDLKVGERYGSGTLIEDIIRLAINDPKYSDSTSIVSAAGGASANIWWDVATDLGDVINYFRAEQGRAETMPLTRDALIRLGSNISTFNNSFKAYMTFRLGLSTGSNYGSREPLAADRPSGEALASLFGISSAELDMGDVFDYMSDRSQRVRDAESVLRHYMSLMVEDPDNTQQHSEDLNTIMRIMMEDDPDIAEEALRRIPGRDAFISNMADRVHQQLERTASRRNLLNQGVEENGEPN